MDTHDSAQIPIALIRDESVVDTFVQTTDGKSGRQISRPGKGDLQ
jgi:hypothetical protein